MDIDEYFEKHLKQGMVKIYPYTDGIREMGFYILIHESTRIINNNKSYQCTLFLKETPYCHDFRPLWDIIGHIESDDYKIENNNLYSIMCDNEVLDFANMKERPNNEKIEDIHKLVDKYNDKLELVQDEKQYSLIKSLFDEYVNTGNYTLEKVENILNSLLR
jgi:hemerythrin superfamily protein